MVEKRGFREALRRPLVSGLPKQRVREHEDDPFGTRPEPLDYLFDLSTPGYVVEFTWRTVGVR